MSLKYTVTKEDHSKLDAGVQALYSQHGDGYRLIVEGVPAETSAELNDARGKVTEFRDSNIALTKERDALKAQLEEASRGVSAAKQGKQTLEDQIAKLTSEFKAEREARQKSDAAAESARMDAAVREAAVKAGIREEAIPDVANRIRSAGAKMNGEGLVFETADGVAVYDPRESGAKLTADRFFANLKDTAEFMFKPTTGDGGGTDGSGVGSAGRRKATWEQSQDPAWQAANAEALSKGEIEIVP